MEKSINQANYSLMRDDSKKSIKIDFSGFFGESDVTEFMKDYQNFKKSVDVKGTTLLLNGKQLKAFPKEAEPGLAELYKDYSTFKKVYIAIPAQIVAKMQVQRVLKSTNLDQHFDFVENIEDVK